MAKSLIFTVVCAVVVDVFGSSSYAGQRHSSPNSVHQPVARGRSGGSLQTGSHPGVPRRHNSNSSVSTGASSSQAVPSHFAGSPQYF